MELSAEDLQAVKLLEERLWMTDFRFDRSWMEAVLADDFFEFGRSGRVYSRDQCLSISGHSINAVLPLPDFKARCLSRDIVQTTYKSIVTYEGGIEFGNRSSIWLRTSLGWELKFHQGTPASG